MRGALRPALEALAADLKDNGVPHANLAAASLKAEDFPQALADADTCLEKMSMWPVACRPPPPPRRFVPPEAPTLDDHTFINPHEVREDSWLMKQSGQKEEDLPDVPDGWEWKRDATSPIEDSWVAVKKTLTQTEVQAIREKILAMQEACFQRKIPEIQELINKAKGEQ